MPARTILWKSGKQALKTAIAGLVSLYATSLFHLPQGYWAAITALIVMQSNVGATLAASRTRLAGTAVGAVVGGVFMALAGANMLGFALAVAIAFYVCDLLRLAESQRLATVTVAIIMLIPATSSAWIVALHRFAEVGLGIVIALLVSLTVWPNHARRSVRQGLADTLRKLAALFQAVMNDYRGQAGIPIEALKKDVAAAVRKNADLLQYALQEAFGPLKERERLALMVHQVERIYHAVETLEFSVRDSAADTYFRIFEDGLEQLQDTVAAALGTLAESIGATKAVVAWPDITGIIGALDERAAEERRKGVSINYPLEEILRFYFLLLTCRNLIYELESVHTLAIPGLAAKLLDTDNSSL